MQEYALFLGCMIPMKLPQIDAAARAAFTGLGVKVEDVEDFSCCLEPWNFKGTDLAAWLKVAGRNLAVAEARGIDILTLCNGCSATLIEAAHLMRDGRAEAEEARKVLSKAGYKDDNKAKASHAVTFLSREVGKEKVEKSCKRRLSGLKVAVHYGCHLLRPSDVMELDDPFQPSFLDELVREAGAEPVECRGTMSCCGSAVLERGVSQAIAEEKLKAVEEAEVHCVVVICLACLGQFDLGQVELGRKAKKEARRKPIPVIHYFQLLVMTQGAEVKKLGFNRYKVKVDDLLKAVVA